MIEALIGNAEAFPVLAERDYFNHAGCSPLPAVVRDALRDFSDHFARRAYLDYDLGGVMGRVRSLYAGLVNAHPDEVALMHNTSEGIATVALGLDWKPGDRVVISDAEYPANVYPWMAAAERFGIELVTIRERTGPDGRARVATDDLLAAADHPGTRLVAVSHVQWGSGQLTDVARLGDFCRGRGVLLSVDAIQSLGVVPVDVAAMKIDFLQAGSHKWTLAPMGGGLLYVRRDLIERLTPPSVGWLNVVNPLKWEEIDFTLRDTAGRFEPGTHPLPTLAGLEAALKLVAGVGVAAIHRRVAELGDKFAAGAEALGHRVVSPREEGKSGAVCFVPGDGEAEALYKRLAEAHQTELAYRCGRIRFAPHFYNTDDQVERLLERLA